MGVLLLDDVTESSLADTRRPRHGRRSRYIALSAIALLAGPVCLYIPFTHSSDGRGQIVPQNAREILDTCARATLLPNTPSFEHRRVSERFEPGTRPTLIQNATIWTGVKENSHVKVVRGDLLLDGGVIQGVYPDGVGLEKLGQELYVRGGIETKNVNGAWVTPAIFDMHSHVGDSSLPNLRGSADDNSLKSPIMPFLRSIDGLNTHDEAYGLFRAGGVATSLVLPGSADNIGGQAFAIKISRGAQKRGPSAMVLEPPKGLFVPQNTSETEGDNGVRWRHIKHACGENPSGVYSQTRMDSIWEFRRAYDRARELLLKQDAYCESAQAGRWNEIQGKEYPVNLELEALVDVLRGRTKVHVHCYEAVDIDGLVRLTNEFKFSVAAFHHAHEAYLIPDLIKKAWGKTPALAIFSTFARYKREAYRGTQYAAKILHEKGLKVIMKSDGPPALNARYLMYEAALAHYYGLPEDEAIASLTTTPAETAGYAHRLGYIKPGYDADLIIWDSHPLALGATPQQVYIDGAPQLDHPAVLIKPEFSQFAPQPPTWDREANDTIAADGLPELLVSERAAESTHTVVFENVKSFVRGTHIREFGAPGGTIVALRGNVTCVGAKDECTSHLAPSAKYVDLKQGSIIPGLVSFGAAIGLSEIMMEESTNDGSPPDALEVKVPTIAGGDGLVVKAVDGLSFAGRNALLSHRGGVTTVIEAPSSPGLIQGVSVAFRTGARNKLEPGAVPKREVALHARIIHDDVGGNEMVSTRIATLRKLLLDGLREDKDGIYAQVSKGKLPLVVSVEKADIMATLLELKSEIEAVSNSILHLVFAGATESHLIASEISKAGVGVILAPLRSFARNWDQKRYIPGPPITYETPLQALQKAGVTVALGISSVDVTQAWDVPNTRFNLGWALTDSNGALSAAEALALSTTKLEKLFQISDLDTNLVAYRGGDAFGYDSKPVGILSSSRGRNELFSDA